MPTTTSRSLTPIRPHLLLPNTSKLLRVITNTRRRARRLSPIFRLRQVQLARQRLAITKQTNNLDNIRPRRERFVVRLLERVNRHQEQELFAGHLAFFGTPHEIAATTTRPATTLKTSPIRPTHPTTITPIASRDTRPKPRIIAIHTTIRIRTTIHLQPPHSPDSISTTHLPCTRLRTSAARSVAVNLCAIRRR